jgi:AcrR family transcriptional regulator
LGIHGRSSRIRKRKYELKQRAEQQQETRRRIVEAAVALHESVGPLAASISAIARRAGVERPTLRAHFPDKRSLFKACTALYFASHPPPDAESWMQIPNPRERLQQALIELYSYYGRNERLLTNVTRDARLAPELIGLGYKTLLARMREVLSTGWEIDDEPQSVVQAALGHALHFVTWRSLARDHGLRDEQAVELMVNLVARAKGMTAGRYTSAIRSNDRVGPI